MNYKVGQVLYSAFADTEDGKVSVSEYVVRSIRKRARKRFCGRLLPRRPGEVPMVHAVLKLKDLTWVKRSKKHFDWGWSDSIPHWMRHNTPQGTKFWSLHTTKRAALVDELKSLRESNKKYGKEETSDKLESTLKSMISRCSKKK